MLVSPAREIGVPAIAVGATDSSSRHGDAGERTQLWGGCMVVGPEGAVHYWRPSTQPEMHRFDLHLPTGRVTAAG